MKLRTLALAALAGTAALVSAPVFADHDHGWRGNKHHWKHHQPRHFYYAPPRPVYVVPPPRVVYGPPVVYPAPVYPPAVVYSPAPAYYPPAHAEPSVSIRLRVPL